MNIQSNEFAAVCLLLGTGLLLGLYAFCHLRFKQIEIRERMRRVMGTDHE